MQRSGLRVVTQAMPGARSASVVLLVPVGSRHEDDAHAGLSHFLEHLVFKGTRAHPEAGLLSQRVEGIGGSVNASTDRELTVYSSKVPAEHVAVALEAVSELALRPLLRRRDLTAEKPVIVDEIRMYVDSPSDHVFTLFDEMLYAGHPLGREIAGTIGSVRRATHRGGRRPLAGLVPDSGHGAGGRGSHRPRRGGARQRRVASPTVRTTSPGDAGPATLRVTPRPRRRPARCGSRIAA